MHLSLTHNRLQISVWPSDGPTRRPPCLGAGARTAYRCGLSLAPACCPMLASSSSQYPLVILFSWLQGKGGTSKYPSNRPGQAQGRDQRVRKGVFPSGTHFVTVRLQFVNGYQSGPPSWQASSCGDAKPRVQGSVRRKSPSLGL